MMDTKDMYVYENQRWNPLTGFTTRGLPTDRYMWSDETGKEKLMKDNIKLQNMHWQWVTLKAIMPKISRYLILKNSNE